MLGIDLSCSYKRYNSDVFASTAIGEVNPKILELHSGLRQALDAILEALRPGTPVFQVFEIGDRALEREGIQVFIWYLGHGIGRDVHDESSKSAAAYPLTLPESP